MRVRRKLLRNQIQAERKILNMPRATALFSTQPASVWAISLATAFAFIGIGIVSPILPVISQELDASAPESMLLFTSYLAVSAFTMFFAGYIASKMGVKNTLLLGLILIVVFAALAGLSTTISQVIGFRAGWGVGNALFITMALAGIVGAASGGTTSSIMLYEAALGCGMALGPLTGGLLGSVSWRAPFLGTAFLMAVAAVTVLIFVKPSSKPRLVPPSAGFRALRKGSLLLWSSVSFLFNFTIVCLLAYSPHVIAGALGTSRAMGHSTTLGLVFFGWGVALAVCALVFPGPLKRRLGLVPAMLLAVVAMAGVTALIALNLDSAPMVVTGTILLGGCQGIMSTLLTQSALDATDLPRSEASSAFSALRFLGGAAFPLVSAPLLALWGAPAPYWGSVTALLAILVLIVVGRRVLPPVQQERGSVFSSRIQANTRRVR